MLQPHRTYHKQHSSLEDHLFIVVLVGYFLALYGISVYFFQNRLFDHNNIFFDSDPYSNLLSITKGWSEGRNAISHPLFELLSLPTRLFANGLPPSLFGIPTPQLIGLGYSPAAVSCAVWVLRDVMRMWGLPTTQVYLGLCLFSLSGSNLVFGTLPETYSLSGLGFAILLRLYTKSTQTHMPVWHWFGLSILLSGITITNALMVFLLYALHLWHQQKRSCVSAVLRSGLVTASALALIWVFFNALLLTQNTISGVEGQASWIEKHATFSAYRVFSNTLNYLTALSSAHFVYHLKVNEEQILLVRGQADALIIGIHMAWVFGVAVGAYINRKQGFQNLATAAILLCNLAIHAVFGYDMFLYSQHWLAAMTLLTTTAFAGQTRWLATTALCAALTSLISGWQIYQLVETEHFRGFIELSDLERSPAKP